MKKNLSRVFSMLLVFTLAFSLMGPQIFAATITGVTFDDPADFAIVRTAGATESIKAVALTGTGTPGDPYGKQDIVDAANVSWTSTNTGIVKFLSGGSEVNSISGTDTVTIKVVGAGRANVVASYAGYTVHSVVDSSTDSNTLSTGIDLEVKGKVTDHFTINDMDVQLFSLKAIFGPSYNDSSVLQNKVTALHALLYGLERYYDPDYSGGVEVTDVHDPAWDWDWVSTNVMINYGGAYVYKIGADINWWVYKVNGSSPAYGASQYVLSNNAVVYWESLK